MNICDNENALIIFQLISAFIRLITIAVPILLIISGMLDFYKTIVSNDPDLSKTMKVFFKRLGAAVLVFITIPIVTFVIGIASPNSKASACLEKFINGVDMPTNTQPADEPVVIDEDIIAENKEKCEENNRVYIKQLKKLVPSDVKNTELYLESGDYSYICTDGEVE